MRQSQHEVGWIGILTVTVAFFTTPARAQSGSMAGAEALLAEGNRLFDEKDYPAALVKFQQAHQLHQDPSILVNLGLTLEKLDRLPEAAARFEQFLGRADPKAHARLIKGIRPKLEACSRREYAYRAGTTTAFYNGYNGDSKLCSSPDGKVDKMAWYIVNAYNSTEKQKTTHPVAQKLANPWKLYDMAGNVIEWCHDRFQDDLGSSLATDPHGATSGTARVVKGGDINSYPGLLRGAYRGSTLPQDKDGRTGFRCVRTITP